MASQKIWIEQLALVPAAVITEHRHDRVPRAQPLRERDRARHAVRAFNQWMTDQLGPERVGRLLEDLQQLNINLVRYPTDATIAEVGPDANPDSNAA